MERDINQQTTLCKGGCGFYGSSATDGLCSKCFKDTLKRKQDPGRLSPSSIVSVPTVSFELPKPTPSSSATSADVKQSCSTEARDASEAALAADLASSAERDCSTSSLSSEAGASDAPADAAAPKKKSRCAKCRSRVGLTGFTCRCGGLYCGEHRYSDQHNCSFDYKAHGAQEIAKNNPVVVSKKIEKI